MAKQILLRTFFAMFFSLLFGSKNHSADFLPAINFSESVAPVYSEHPRFNPANSANHVARIPVVEKGHFFQFLVEEEAHIHVFCFDRLRKRRRFCNLICFLTRLSLLVIHLNIMLYHVDHMLHHQLHYLLKGFMA